LKTAVQHAALALVSTVLAIIVLQGGASVYFGRSLEGSIWIYSGDKTLKFDPVRGFRLTTDVTMESRITNGEIEYVGASHGNNVGYPGRDFTPARRDQRRRFAVFGDSFTHGVMLPRTWPDYVEDLTGNDARPVELLNFSLTGGGVANWWSIVKNEMPSYQLDGVIFAVYQDDLFRSFTMIHTANRKMWIGRTPTWNPALIPKTLDAAWHCCLPEAGQRYFIFDEAGFWRALSGEWRPGDWFIQQEIRAIKAHKVFPQLPPPSAENEKWRQAMIKDIATWIAEQHLTAIVVYLPSRDGLLAQDDDSIYKADAERFAQAIGATYNDSSVLYASMSNAEIRAHFLPHDGHWNLAGSDLLATYVRHLLSDL
jgi:hypothetical protein